jgi:tetratricopeptide (TPR) repeat protein
MVHFAYPNIKRGQFVGCGRFIVFEADQQLKGYNIATPESSTLQDVIESASILAPERSDPGQLIYEKNDHDGFNYLGDSLDLAYLLVRISRSRTLQLTIGKRDIWCTGCIELLGERPKLKPVNFAGFEAKLKAFLSHENPDVLFIVPDINIDQNIRLRLNKRKDVRVWSLADISFHDLFEIKTILKVRRDELAALVTIFFGEAVSSSSETRMNVRLQNLRDFTVQIRVAGTATVVGTGIVVSSDGKIVTCAEVVESALGRHPGQAGQAEVDVYFPQLFNNGAKVERAKVAACLSQYDDNIVLLQLNSHEAPLTQEQLPVLGNAELSKGNPFETYGYIPGTGCHAIYANGSILSIVEPPPTKMLLTAPVQLHTDHVEQEIHGAAVLDKRRNLIVGIISRQYLPKSEGTEHSSMYAVNTKVLAFDPFNLAVQDAPFPKRAMFQPRLPQPISTEPDLEIAWNNAPAPLETWVGREMQINEIIADWNDPERRMTGLIGFGGEGKSCLARNVVENLLYQKGESKRRPDGLFWWGFYTRPNVDEFFEALLIYLSGKRIDPRTHPSSTNARVHFIAGMLYGGNYLFVLDGLEIIQHQEGDQYGSLKSNELHEFLNYIAAPGHGSFCLITSRVPVLDLMDYTTYTHRDITSLGLESGQALLTKMGVNGDSKALNKIVMNWGSHALTLSLIGSCLVKQYGGDAQRIDEISPPTVDEPCYDRVNRVLRRYDSQLNEAEHTFLMIFSAFRTPVDQNAFNHVFRAQPVGGTVHSKTPLHAAIATLDESGFQAMLSRLTAYRILNYDPAINLYTAHPLVVAYYKKRLNEEYSAHIIQEMYHIIKEYYLSITAEKTEPSTLEDLVPLIEAVYYACLAGSYDEAFSILNQHIQQKGRRLLSDILGAWDTYLAIMQEFFQDSDNSEDPQVSIPKEKCKILHEIGYALRMMGRLSEVESYYKRSIAIDLEMEYWRDVSCGYQNLVELYGYFGALDASMKAAHTSLAMSRRAGYTPHEISSLCDQAWVFCLRGELETASATFRQAEALQRKYEPDIRYLYKLNGIKYADYLRRAGDPAYARCVTEANLKICLNEGRKDYVSWCHRILGDLDADADQHESAQAYYDEAIKIARGIVRRDLLINVLFSRGKWEARYQQDVRAALDDLHEALNYTSNSGYHLYEVDIRVALAWAYLAEALKRSLQRNIALDNAWVQAGRAERMSLKMGYYWGKTEAEEIKTTVDNFETL